MHEHEQPLLLPPRYDAALAAGAIIGYGGALLFLISQNVPGLRLDDDMRFSIGLWCIAISGPAAICWLLRPRLIHLAYAIRLGLALAALPTPSEEITPRRAIIARRWIWCSAGTVGACVWTVAAGIDLGAFTGRLTIHGAGLDLSTMLLCQLGAVCECVRVLGPSLATVDEVYQAARRRGEGPGGTVLEFRRPTG